MSSLKLNIEYAATFGAYWMICAIASSFASVFMLAKGYDNTHIGMTLAAANLLALSMQPFVADRMDTAKGTAVIDASVLMTAVMMLAGAGYFIFSGRSFMLAATIAVILAIHTSIQPILNSLAFRLSESGTEVSFGIGRAGGSLGYSAIMAVIGTLVEKKGEMVLPVCTEAACAALIIFLFLIKGSFIRLAREKDKEIRSVLREQNQNAGSSNAEERIDLKDFIRRNKHFFIMNLGVAGLFFSNSILSNYMPQIAANVGGTTEQAGRVLSLMALAEIPTMFFFDKIRSRFSSRALIKLAAFGFTAKIAVFWLARSVSMFYAAQVFQFIAFALIMPAMVYFINGIMSPGEAVKGQALFTMMITFSTIAASLTGGWILDSYGAGMLTFTAFAVTATGAAVVIFSIDKVKSHRSLPSD